MNDPTSRHCPECGARPGNPCTYLPVYPDSRFIRSTAVIKRQEKTGTPTKRVHNGRMWDEQHRLREWLRNNGPMFWEMEA
jgi:hypothetical protein